MTLESSKTGRPAAPPGEAARAHVAGLPDSRASPHHRAVRPSSMRCSGASSFAASRRDASTRNEKSSAPPKPVAEPRYLYEASSASMPSPRAVDELQRSSVAAPNARVYAVQRSSPSSIEPNPTDYRQCEDEGLSVQTVMSARTSPSDLPSRKSEPSARVPSTPHCPETA